MNKPDDFDLIPRQRPSAPQTTSTGGDGIPPQEPPEWQPEDGNTGGRRSWILVVVILGVALLGFGIGAALFTLRDRMSDTPPTPQVSVVTPSATPPGWLSTLEALATITATTLTPSPSVTATVTITTTATPTPSPTLTPVPTACPLPVANGFANAWRRETFGCATTGAQIVWAAYEPFERGAMLWRSDTNKSYLFTLGGTWQQINAGWDGQSVANRGEPPPGLYTPERGFGWVWGTSDPVFAALGWATDIEKGFCAEVQDFEDGWYLQSMPVDSCTAEGLYNQASAGDWRPVYVAAHESGVWSGSLGGSAVVSPAPTTNVQLDARPEANGTVRAARGDSVTLDGNLDEWPESGWLPIANVVQGQQEQRGPRDAFATFQVAWTNQGLILALRAQDDRFRPGPQGTDMWQGDGIEIQIDTNLAQDFSDASANGDDFQLGIGFLEDGRSLQMFRWLPLGQDGPVPVIGAGSAGDGGYAVEAIIPWGYLNLASPGGATSFGFNVSMVDNDGRRPEQETVISFSPARTTYNNPTQWGTLVLVP